MTPATLFLAAVGFAVIVGGALLLVVIVEWRVKRQLQRFHDD